MCLADRKGFVQKQTSQNHETTLQQFKHAGPFSNRVHNEECYYCHQLLFGVFLAASQTYTGN